MQHQTYVLKQIVRSDCAVPGIKYLNVQMCYPTSNNYGSVYDNVYQLTIYEVYTHPHKVKSMVLCSRMCCACAAIPAITKWKCCEWDDAQDGLTSIRPIYLPRRRACTYYKNDSYIYIYEYIHAYTHIWRCCCHRWNLAVAQVLWLGHS